MGTCCPATLVSSQQEELKTPSALKYRLVVASFDEQGVPDGMGDVVSDMLTRAIDVPHFELLERRQVRRVLEEQAFATSDLTQPGDAIRYGLLLDTRFVLIGTIYRLEGVYIVSARMVDSATGVVQESARGVVQFRTVDEMAARVADLARLLGLRMGPPLSPSEILAQPIISPVPTSQATPQSPPKETDSVQPTVRDYLEQVGISRKSEVRVDLETSGRMVRVGEEIQFKIQSKFDGFLSLFVVDAIGNVGVLIPNEKLPQQKIQAGVPIVIPRDVSFTLKAKPPLGATRVKAIVTRNPIPVIGGSSEAGNILHRVELGEVVGAPNDLAGKQTQAEWSSAELEFLVVPLDYSPRAAASEIFSGKPVDSVIVNSSTNAVEVIQSALYTVLDASRTPSETDIGNLRWPLKSPFQPSFDIGWVRTPSKLHDIRIAVIDADFDPDDPVLERAFREMTPINRGELRNEIRRNGPSAVRHGNRISSLIAGDTPWLPSVLPGAIIVPIRITTAMGAPEYRADHGGATELLGALRTALTSGCRVVNLSLSVLLEGEELRRFSSDPIWDQLDKAGVVIVCAAGNISQNLDEKPLYPSCLDRPNILCVGAVGVNGALASWNGQGSAYGLHSVDIVAPGTWMASSNGGGQASLGSGTSYACALASGAVAQLIMNEPNLRPNQVIERLMADARPLPGLIGRTRAGLLQWPVSRR